MKTILKRLLIYGGATFVGLIALVIVISVLFGEDPDGDESNPPNIEATQTARDSLQATVETAERQRATEAAEPTAQENVEKALDEMIDLMEEFDRGPESDLFRRAAIKNSGRRLEITVTDFWFLLSDINKERAINIFGKAYAAVAANNNLRGDTPDSGNYPTTSFIETTGIEVAYQSTLRTRVLR